MDPEPIPDPGPLEFAGQNVRPAAWETLYQNLRQYRVTSTPGMAYRQEISDFCEDGWTFNLFLLAMEKIQKDITADDGLRKGDLAQDWLGFFGLAGIHGSPPVDWAGVPQKAYFQMLRHEALGEKWTSEAAFDWEDPKNQKGSAANGYCVHATPLFLIWHRPYLALMEQVIAMTVHDIAMTYENSVQRSLALKAAQKIRMPYWNPFRPISGSYDFKPRDRPVPTRGFGPLVFGLPPPLSSPWVRVCRPNERLFENIQNPLYQFTFPDQRVIEDAFPQELLGVPDPGSDTNPKADIKAGKYLLNKLQEPLPDGHKNPAKTLRRPNNNGISQHLQVNEAVTQAQAGLRNSLFNVFNSEGDFIDISCSKVIDRTLPTEAKVDTNNPDEHPSFETYHDQHHYLLGSGKGTMASQKVAAFDPVFWFLHSYYEYCFCMWQTIHYSDDKYFKQDYDISRGGTDNCAYMRGDTKESDKTPLLPFAKPPAAGGVVPGDVKEYWDARSCRDWTQFGYTYPGLPNQLPTNDADKEKAKDAAVTIVNSIYGWKQDRTTPQFLPSVKRYMSVIKYTLLPFHPRLKADDGVLSDNTTLDDLIEDQPPPIPAGSGPAAIAHGVIRRADVEVTDTTPRAPSGVLPPPGAQAPQTAAAPIAPARAALLAKNTGNLPIPPGPMHAEFSPGRDRRFVLPSFLEKDGKMRQWYFNFKVERFALSGPFTINVFIGDFDPNPESWPNDPNHVCRGVILVSESESDGTFPSCANCQVQRKEKAIYGGSTPITLKLIEYAKSGEKQPPGPDGMVLKSLEPNDVVPFLRRNLHWRVATFANEEVQREDTPGLRIAIVSREMTFPERITELPKWSAPEVFPDITHGRPTGLDHPDIASKRT